MPARAAITGGKFLADGWSLSGATLTTRFTWVVGGKFSTVGGTMPGADLSAAGSLSPSAIVARTTAATMGAGAQVAGGVFTLSGTPAAAALSAAAAAVAGGVFTPVARNIGGAAFSAAASINAGISGDGPKGGTLGAAAGVVGGFFTGVQKGAAISASASMIKGQLPVRFSDVVLQIPGDGTNNSTNIVDVSNNALTITRSGSPVISTAASVFGGASVRFYAATTDALSVNNAATAVSTQDFWFEMRLKFFMQDLTTNFYLNYNHDATTFAGAGGTNRITFATLNGKLRLIFTACHAANEQYYAAADDLTLTMTDFNHYAAGRVGSELAVWVNGTMYQMTIPFVGGDKNIGNKSIRSLGNRVHIGARLRETGYFDNGIDAYMDDFRFVKATPPWGLANFTPPIAAHPTS